MKQTFTTSCKKKTRFKSKCYLDGKKTLEFGIKNNMAERKDWVQSMLN